MNSHGLASVVRLFISISMCFVILCHDMPHMNAVSLYKSVSSELPR